jgi:aryl-alcohol dehydrogenase-like predicted oxidoreductase
MRRGTHTGKKPLLISGVDGRCLWRLWCDSGLRRVRGPVGTFKDFTMKQRRILGSNGPEVSPVGLGCMGLSEFYAPVDRERALSVIASAVDAGIDFFDTADVYGFGANELLLGAALKPVRSAVVIASKCGIVRRADDPAYRGVDGSPAYVRACLHQSLRRLQTDHIDLSYVHRIDPQVPIEDTVGELARARSAGLIGHIGLSNVSASTLRRACRETPITAVQNEYSLWTRDPERELLPACAELGVGFVPYSPIGRGFLSGGLTSLQQLGAGDFRHSLPRFESENFDRNQGLARRLGALAADLGLSPATLSLAWVLSRAPWVVPIPGTSRPERHAENLAAAAVRIDARTAAALEAIFPVGAASGEPYADPAAVVR